MQTSKLMLKEVVLKLNISKNLVLFNGSVLNADIAFWMTTRQNLSQRFIGSSFRESVQQGNWPWPSFLFNRAFN